MSLTDRIQLAWLALAHGSKALRMVPTWDVGQQKPLPVDYESLAKDGYSRNELVYACIGYIARAVSQTQARVLQGEEEVGDGHPLRALLDRPNPEMGLFDLLEATVVMLNIAGDAYWEKERARGGKVLALWPMRPDRVKVVPGPAGVDHYVYSVSGLPDQILMPGDVVHFQYYNPVSDWFGLAPLQVAARAADVDNERTDYTRAFFQNAAVPYGLLKTKVKLVDAEAKRIQKLWMDNYGGVDNWHKVAVLDSDAEYQRIGLTQQEMAFPDLTTLSETRICMAFGVPPILVGAKAGLDRATYSNYGEARRAFWEDMMLPTLRKLEDLLNLQLALDFGDVEIDFDASEVRALQEDRTATFARAVQGFTNGLITKNEARLEVGFDQTPGGDVYAVPFSVNLVPVAREQEMANALMDRRMNPPEPPVPEQEGDAEEPATEEPPPATGGKAAKAFGREMVGESIERVARAHELAFLRQARMLFAEEEASLLAVLGGLKGQRKGYLDALWLLMLEALERVGWAESFLPLFTYLVNEQGQATSGMLGIAFDVHNPAVEEFIRSYSFQFADKLGQTTRESLRDMVERAQAEGWSIPTFQRNLRDVYAGWSDGRAEVIARTETIRSSNAGAEASYRAAGVERKEWYTVGDDRRCAWCAAMHGKIVGIAEPFFRQGDVFTAGEQTLSLGYETVSHPPLHPNCRCTLLPVVE